MPYIVLNREDRLANPDNLETYNGTEMQEFDIPVGPYGTLSEAIEVATALADYLETPFVVAVQDNGLVLYATHWEPVEEPNKREPSTKPKIKRK